MGVILWVLAAGGTVAVAVLSRLLAEDAKAQMPRLTDWLLACAVARLPSDQRERYWEEWSNWVLETPGELCKVRAAFQKVLASRRIVADFADQTIREYAQSLVAEMDAAIAGDKAALASPRLTPSQKRVLRAIGDADLVKRAERGDAVIASWLRRHRELRGIAKLALGPQPMFTRNLILRVLNAHVAQTGRWMRSVKFD